MELALNQARINLGNTGTNPSVGCIITKKNTVISAECTSLNGRPHAEYNAINSLKVKPKNAEIYVTLEPCSHYGVTPPCTRKIIKNKFKKVFFSINDPDIRSFNKSFTLLKKKKIIVKKGLNFNKANFFYRSYIKSKKSFLPFVTSKLAISKDYFTASKKKEWITNVFSRLRGHLIRSSHDCIITSSKTIIDDNSRLTCRIKGLEKRSPSRIILDNKLKISLKSNIIKEAAKYHTIIFYNINNIKKIKKLKKLKIKLLKISLDIEGNLDLYEVLTNAKKLGFNRILLEAGQKLINNFFNQDLINDFYLFQSKNYLRKRGRYKMLDNLKLFLKNKQHYNEKVNLFGDNLIVYKVN